jgi:tRNA modification GTPase
VETESSRKGALFVAVNRKPRLFQKAILQGKAFGIRYNFSMLVFDTIAALATANTKAALSIVRLSGEESLRILSHLVTRDPKTIEPNHMYYGILYRDASTKEEMIDEAEYVYYKAPRSYTGFDGVEFFLHGNPLISESLLSALVFWGARRAERGEFSAQAYFNGKMDLLKAEGINDLINATSKRAVDIASNTLSGKNSEAMSGLKARLLESLSQLEYYVENQYEDDDSDHFHTELDKVDLQLQKETESLLETIRKTKQSNREYQGFKVAIVGEPNVGKSTLLNKIVGEDRAIVSPIPGTTRDVVTGEREIDGIRFSFEDTAGIRKTSDVVENLGIERSYNTIRNADLVLLLSESGFKEFESLPEIQEAIQGKPVLRIATKKDLHGENKEADITVSDKEDDMALLLSLFQKKLSLENKEASSFLGEREEDFLIEIEEQLEKTRTAIQETHSIDVVSDSLREAVHMINSLMGKDENATMEDIYQTLFSHFCLGK